MDDYEVCSLGKGKTKTKVTAVYLCIGNIDYKYQCRREDISLVAIGRTLDIEAISSDKMIGRRVFFSEIVRQLNEINSNPIMLRNSRNEEYTCKIELLAVPADNLALNQMLGLPESFSNSQCCQYCTIQFMFFKTSVIERVLNDLDHVFKECIFSGSLFVPDVFHDFHEGNY